MWSKCSKKDNEVLMKALEIKMEKRADGLERHFRGTISRSYK